MARLQIDTQKVRLYDGLVKDGGAVKGQRKMIIVPDDASEPREYALPQPTEDELDMDREIEYAFDSLCLFCVRSVRL